MSYINIDKIVQKEASELQRRYINATNIKFRTQADLFSKDMDVLNKIEKTTKEIYDLTATHSSVNSNFLRIVALMQLLIKHIQKDFDTLSADATVLAKLFDEGYGQSLEMFDKYAYIVDEMGKEIIHIIEVSEFQESVHPWLEEKVNIALENVRFLTATAALMKKKFEDHRFAFVDIDVWGEDKEILDKLASHTRMCSYEFRRFKAESMDYEKGLVNTITPNTTLLIRIYFSRVFKNYNGAVDDLNKCIHNYETTMDGFKATSVAIKDKMAVLYTVFENIGSVHERGKALEYKLSELYILSSANKMYYRRSKWTKREVYKSYRDQSDALDKLISDLKTFIITDLSQPLKKAIEKSHSQIGSDYQTFLESAATVYDFLNPIRFYDRVGELKLFKQPLPENSSESELKDANMPLWRTWDANTDNRNFLQSYSQKYIDRNLQTFCDPLLLEIDIRELSILQTLNKLSDINKQIKDEYQEIVAGEEIKEEFIT